jgi:hypothetical protein
MPIKSNILASVLLSIASLLLLLLLFVCIYYLLRCTSAVERYLHPPISDQGLELNTQAYGDAWYRHLSRRGHSVDTLPMYESACAETQEGEEYEYGGTVEPYSSGRARVAARKSGDMEGFVDVPLNS